MKTIRLIILTLVLFVAGIALLRAPRAEAGGAGFTYGIGFQNIPLDRYAYVAQAAVYPQPVWASFIPTTKQEKTTMAYAETGAGSFATASSKPPRTYTPKKELLPLTGPRLN